MSTSAIAIADWSQGMLAAQRRGQREFRDRPTAEANYAGVSPVIPPRLRSESPMDLTKAGGAESREGGTPAVVTTVKGSETERHRRSTPRVVDSYRVRSEEDELHVRRRSSPPHAYPVHPGSGSCDLEEGAEGSGEARRRVLSRLSP
ncbi:hypothetical protein B0H16DRAFT_1452610 [Mycena metata]|uniref:Uncharacterized protein n=1 Tax=Mycena metata TaxID=1033252 RepID=A0AAD7NNU0_9AGAR|nr:hypothetical protein B0H16DRAFT_1452610 [Mycena metata]